MGSSREEQNQDSFSLDPKWRVLKTLTSFKTKFVTYLNQTEEGKFGSCNEFTLGMSKPITKVEENHVKN